MRITSQAVAPGSPTSPRPLRDAGFAALLGLLLGVGIALVRDALDRTVTDPDDLESTLGFPLLGYVRSDILGTAPVSRNGTIDVAEHLDSFRILRANSQFLGGDRPLATLAVTSPLPDEGKSTVAAWYAYANALAGKRTILVECDLHRPVIAEGFELDPSPGLTDYLTGDAEASGLRRSVMVEGPTAQPLSVVPAGAPTPQSAELLASPRFEKLLDEIAREHELVVLDCPPLLPVADTLSHRAQGGGGDPVRPARADHSRPGDRGEGRAAAPPGAAGGACAHGLEAGERLRLRWLLLVLRRAAAPGGSHGRVRR